MLDRLSTYDFPPTGVPCYYHTASVRNALDILEFNHLFGSFPSKVNDPDDLRMSIENLDKSPYLQSRACGLSLTAIQEGLDKNVKAIMDRTYRFVCLAEASRVDSDKQSELRFWDEYAAHFKGVRFKFIVDKKFLLTPSPNDALVGRMDYTGRTATIDASNVSNMSDIKQLIAQDQFLMDLCYSKSDEWKSEYEMRIGSTYSRLKLEMSTITSKEERFFCFSSESIIEVSVGYNADKIDIWKLKMMLQARNIPLKVAQGSLHYETL